MTRTQFDVSNTLNGANFIGSPNEVIEKILLQHELFGHQRFLLMMGLGIMPHQSIMHAIELFGTKVTSVLWAEIAERNG